MPHKVNQVIDDESFMYLHKYIVCTVQCICIMSTMHFMAKYVFSQVFFKYFHRVAWYISYECLYPMFDLCFIPLT